MPVPSDRLSRWTLTMFACALANLLLAQALAVSGRTWPAVAVSAGGTLAAVHLVTIGWLTLLMFGALFQFVPVITSRPLPAQWLSLVTLVSLELGLAAMVVGFLAVGAGDHHLAWCLPTGATLVFAGICTGLGNVLAPLATTWPLSLPARFVLAGQMFLLLTMLLGLSMALTLALPGGTVHMRRLLAGGVGYHGLAGLGGWLTLTAMGVGYKLLPMFMLAREDRGLWGEGVFLLGTTGVALAVIGGLAHLWLASTALVAVTDCGWGALGLSVLLYLVDLTRLYRGRQRAQLELHNRAAVGAFVSLGIALGLGIALFVEGRPGSLGPSLVLLVLLGWLGGLGLTQLYKIIAFLTWLRRFGSRLGRDGIPPRVQDLVDERRAAPWFALYFLAVWLAAGACAAGNTTLGRVGIVGAMLATLGLVIEYARTRWGQVRRAAVPLPDPFPQGGGAQ